jgi:lysophospholipase L1-like esterase
MLLAASVIVSLVIVEFWLSITDYSYHPLSTKIAATNDQREAHMFLDKDTVYDPVLLWKPNIQGSVIFNSQGFRGVEINETNSEYFKIFALGDSNTVGENRLPDMSWPRYLGDRARRDNDKVIVLNAGVWGYSSFQILNRFKQILPYKPNMVLVSASSNDAHLVKISDRDWHHKILPAFVENIRLYQLYQSVEDKVVMLANHDSEFGLVHRVSLEDYEQNLLEMIDIAQSRNITLVLLTRPFVGGSNSPWWWKNFGPLYNNLTKEVARRRAIMVIDAYSRFRNNVSLFADESHFTREGDRMMADCVYDNIKGLITDK